MIHDPSRCRGESCEGDCANLDAPVPEVTSPRDVKIAIARQAIESCLCEGDQLADGHEIPFDDSTVVVFRAGCPDWQRGADLETAVRKAMADQRLDSWAKRTLDRGETRVEIRVVVGAVDRVPVGAP